MKFTSLASGDCKSESFSTKGITVEYFSWALGSSPSCRNLECYQSLLAADLSTGSTWAAGINYSGAWSVTVHMFNTFWTSTIKCLLWCWLTYPEGWRKISALQTDISSENPQTNQRDQIIFSLLWELSSDLKQSIIR